MALTIQCKLTFPDGRVLRATGRFVGPEDFNVIEYRGAADRIQDRPRASSVGLKLLFQDLAAQTGGHLQLRERGAYDSWAL